MSQPAASTWGFSASSSFEVESDEGFCGQVISVTPEELQLIRELL